MKSYSASIKIHASPDTVWKILTDADHYPDWDPGMDRVEGRLAAGERVRFYTKLSPDQAFPVRVTAFEPGKKMTLTGGLPFGLFKSERTHILTPEGEAFTHFSTAETFSGVLFPLFGKNIPDLNESFNAFAAGLKKEAEKS